MTELTKTETLAVQKAVASHWWLALRAMREIRETLREPTDEERVAIAVWAGCELKMAVRRVVGDRITNIADLDNQVRVVILCANPVLITLKEDGRFVIEEKEKPRERAASGLRLVKG